MRGLTSFLLLASTCLVEARSRQHVGRRAHEPARRASIPSAQQTQHIPRDKQPTSPFLNNKSQKFVVQGTGIPDVNFDIGESYAGLLPISSNANETGELYFWFFPSTNPDATDEITIWLNGGPGCSSLEGLLQENGPFLWQYGTFLPVANPWAWSTLTNMVWVEQPVGTGFSQGTPTARSEADVASQFMGFFKNFVETFALQGKKVFIAGESYAGQYVPYIADAMLNANDTTNFNLQAIMIYDPVISSDTIQEQIPAVAFVNYWDHLFSLNDTTMASLNSLSESCGFTSFMETHLTFPPAGPFPAAPRVTRECDLWDAIFNAVLEINPCFDEYDISTTCPVLWDVLGFPGSFFYTPPGSSVFFNRPDVQRAINAPVQAWEECADGVFPHGDASLPSSMTVLPGVIERTNRTIIGGGMLDFIIIANGTLLAIQNMTWNGLQGFQTQPSDPFFVPYHDNSFTNTGASSLAGAGVFGTTHTERGLTFVEISLSGHMVPQYAPSAAYRHLEFLLGRIDSLTS